MGVLSANTLISVFVLRYFDLYILENTFAIHVKFFLFFFFVLGSMVFLYTVSSLHVWQLLFCLFSFAFCCLISSANVSIP